MPLKGYKQTKLHREKTSKIRLERKKKLGYINSPETREKLSLIAKNQKLSIKHKKRLQEGFNKKIKKQGFLHDFETRQKIRNSKIGEKNPNWNNGSSFEPYSVDWTETLKKSIRERDHYTCQLCGKEPAICVHHIDYNKKNCNPDNLITLCKSCHSKTNNHKSYWENFFLGSKN
jgi:hypothetical protein